jgi:hypothetical protein
LTGSGAAAVLPGNVMAGARDSVGAALIAARDLAASNPAGARLLAATADHAFFAGFNVGCVVAGAVALAGSVVAALFLPARPGPEAPV